jgi:MFS family permease
MSILITTRNFVIYTLAPVAGFVKRMNGTSLLAMAGMAGPLLLIATDFTAAFSNPDYNLIRDSISSLALTSLGWLQTIGFLFIGLLVEIFTAGLLFNVKGARGFRFGIGLLVFFGFAMLIIGAFRTDPVGAARTIEGRIHGLAATAAFWIFPAAILALAPSLRKDPGWKGIFLYTVIAAVLAVPLVITLGVLKGNISWFGLLERIVVANMIIWVEVAAVRLLLISLKRARLSVDREKAYESSPSLS